MNYTQSISPNPQELHDLFVTTFTASEGQEEGQLIGNLAKQLVLTTPPEDLRVYTVRFKNQLVGAIFFTRFTFASDPTQAFIMAPVAVHPDFQGQGIGQKIIQFGHDCLRQEAVTLTITYGDIRFYEKVAYQQISESMIQAPLKLSYPEGWLAQSLNDTPLTPISSKTRCVPTLNDQRYW